MTPGIKLFTNDVAGTHSLLVEFLRNQPGYGPAEDKTGDNRRHDGGRRDEAHHQGRYDSHAHDHRRGERVEQQGQSEHVGLPSGRSLTAAA